MRSGRGGKITEGWQMSDSPVVQKWRELGHYALAKEI